MPILKAALTHKGFAFVDVISPCVTFNDHEGSTKSYAYTRKHQLEVVQADFVPPRDEITADYAAGSVAERDACTTAAWCKLRKVAEDYDPTDRDRAYAYIRERAEAGRGDDRAALHLAGLEGHARAERDRGRAALQPASEQLCPGNEELQKLMGQFR